VTLTPGPLLGRLEEPWDHEMALLETGERALVKREFATDAEVRRLRAAGWTVAVVAETYGVEGSRPDIAVGEGAERTAFVGLEEAVTRAVDLERIERHDTGGERLRAMAEIGDLLGYPSCCTRAYLAQDDQGETASFRRLLEGGRSFDLPATNNLFVLGHQLISHFPCTLDCPVSAAVGDRALELLARSDAGHAEALLILLRSPITIWDRFRVLVEHPVDGDCTADRLTHEPRVLDHPGFQSFHGDLPQVPPGGVRLCFDQERDPS